MAELKTKVVTSTDVRFSYANVLTPSKGLNDDSKEKYSVSILVPKKDAATLKQIAAAIEAAKEEGKSKKWGGKIPPKLKNPMRDGDEERPDDPAYQGMYFFNASSHRKPQVIDRTGKLIEDGMEFYSGCWGRVSINFFPYDTNGNKGIGAGLGNIIKTRDDENLGGGASKAHDDFADLIEAEGMAGDGASYDFG